MAQRLEVAPNIPPVVNLAVVAEGRPVAHKRRGHLILDHHAEARRTHHERTTLCRLDGHFALLIGPSMPEQIRRVGAEQLGGAAKNTTHGAHYSLNRQDA